MSHKQVMRLNVDPGQANSGACSGKQATEMVCGLGGGGGWGRGGGGVLVGGGGAGSHQTVGK